MKIDCPHCGVHGSVDNSLAGKKLRCPKCSKVFLIPKELLSASGDAELMGQELLENEEPRPPASGEQETISRLQEDIDEDEGEKEGEERVAEVAAPADEASQAVCSVCGEAFAPELLEEIDLQLYCPLCKPQAGEEGVEPLVEEGADENVELETCAGCGEALHPRYLESVGSERYCALCLPEEVEEEEDGVEGEAAPLDLAEGEEAMAAETKGEAGSLTPEEEDLEEEEFPQEICSACGESFHPDFLQEVNSRLYCGVCQPEVMEVLPDAEAESVAVASGVAAAADDAWVEEEGAADGPDFTIGAVVKEAWQKTKGAKGAIWGGLLVMYLVLFALGAGAAFGLQGVVDNLEPTLAMGINAVLQLVTSVVSILFTAGIMLIGVRRAAEQRVSWKMAFAGFSKALSVTIALVLQTILILIGFCLLILPGIYLTVGYALALPLILEKGLGPWQALEASRKAIHKKWWTVFAIYLVMGLIYLVSAIPLGLGLIWTVPMFFVGLGVLYRLFFGSALAEEEFGDEEGVEEELEAAPEEM